MLRRYLLGLALTVVVSVQTLAGEPLTAAQEAQLRRSGELNARVVQLYGEGKYAEAVAPAQEAATIRAEVLGEQHPDYAVTLNNLATILETLGRYDESIPLHKKALAIYAAATGKKSEGYATSLNNLAKALVSTGKYEEGEAYYRETAAINLELHGDASADYALSLNNLADTLQQLAKYDEAEELLKQSVTIYIGIYGESHPLVATGLHNLAYVYESTGNLDAAEFFYDLALKIRTEVLTKTHPDYAQSLYSLASVYGKQGRFEEAETMMRQALAIRLEAFGPVHPQIANSLANLAGLYADMGRTDEAAELSKQALTIREKTLGREHPLVAQDLTNLAINYRNLGRLADAEPLAVEAAMLRRKALGEAHPDFAHSLVTLGLIYDQMGREDAAEKMYVDALSIYQTTLGPTHATTAETQQNLGLLYLYQGDVAKAQGLLQTAYDTIVEGLGKEHPRYSGFANSLGDYYRYAGDMGRAAALYHEALELDRRQHGATSEAVANDLNNLALNYLDQGDLKAAEAPAREALEIMERRIEAAARGQAPQAALAYMAHHRHHLWTWLRCVAYDDSQTRAISDRLLKWKGIVSTRQLRVKQAEVAVAASDNPDARALYDEMGDVSQRLSAMVLSRADGEDAAREQAIKTLTERLETVQRQLVAALKTDDPVDDRDDTPTTAELQRLLPAGTALVNYQYYVEHLPNDDADTKFAYQLYAATLATIITRDRVAVVDVGNLFVMREEIRSFRAAVLTRRHGNPWGDESHPGAVLRRRLWEPMLPYLDGIDTVLISPVGEIARLPWTALPSDTEGRYLVEDDRLIVTLPYPRLLPQLLANPPITTTDTSLLLVGDVDYDAMELATGETMVASADTTPGATRGGMDGWRALAGTGPEAEAIGALFKGGAGDHQPVYLHQRDASETAVRAAIGGATYAHIATHGFFATGRGLLDPPALGDLAQENVYRNVQGHHPGVMSGIVLSGVNGRATDTDDGILTALEVESLDLSGCRLAVLSACETGLGATATDGEGVLGLQRAFQLAGARATITSLWKVDDTATRVLMVANYRGLWSESLAGADALRQAQRAVLADPTAAGINARGFAPDAPVTDATTAEPDSVTGKAPPYYWAAFTYSGDWR